MTMTDPVSSEQAVTTTADARVKPVSELPWEAVNFIVYDGGRGLVCDCEMRSDAAYIVHSANAYPRLVAALKAEAQQLRHWANESRNGGWSTHQVDPMRLRAESIDALLRELGELE